MIRFADLFNDCLSRFRETPEYIILSNNSPDGNGLSAQERQAIIDSVEHTFAPLFGKIKADASSITNSDLVFCVLTGIGVGTPMIADCLTISPHTVRVRKHRLREKLPATWYEVFYGEGETETEEVEEPVDEVSHKPQLPFVREISNCFRNYFNTNGRASRCEYYCFFFFAAIVIYGDKWIHHSLYMMSYNVSHDPYDGPMFVILHVFFWLLMLSVIPPFLTVAARRFHDLNCSGWLSLLFCGLPIAIVLLQNITCTSYADVFYGGASRSVHFIPYVVNPLRFSYKVLYALTIVQFLVLSIRGTKGPNDYGPDPLK